MLALWIPEDTGHRPSKLQRLACVVERLNRLNRFRQPQTGVSLELCITSISIRIAPHTASARARTSPSVLVFWLRLRTQAFVCTIQLHVVTLTSNEFSQRALCGGDRGVPCQWVRPQSIPHTHGGWSNQSHSPMP